MVCILAYIPSLVGRAILIGCGIAKGGTERCIARLLLTSLGLIEQKILLLEHVNCFATVQICTKVMTGIYDLILGKYGSTNINNKTVKFMVSILISAITSYLSSLQSFTDAQDSLVVSRSRLMTYHNVM